MSHAMNRRHTTSAYTTITTVKMNISSFQSNDLIPTVYRAELDSHTDTCGVNNTARIISYTGNVAHVSA
jgi:hypothetical protein